MAATKIPQELLEKTSITFADNEKLRFGTSNDLEIYHDGSNSYINDVGTGSLYIKATNLTLADAAGEQFLNAYSNGGVVLYHNNNQKLETNSGGVSVTGTAILGGASFVDNATAYFGTGLDLRIYHDGSNSWINDTGTGDLILKTNGARVSMLAGSDTMFQANKDGEVNLYYNNARKLATTSTGISVTGGVTATTSLSLNGSTMEFDSSNDYMEFNKAVFSPIGYFVGTTGTKVGHLQNSGGVMLMEASTTRQIAFGNETNGEFVRINATGDVGIGGDAPAAKLEVKDGGNDYTSGILLRKGSSTSETTTLYHDNSSATTTVLANRYGSDNARISLLLKHASGSPVNALTAMGTGKVGIGTNSPDTNLEVESSAGASTIIRVKGTASDGYRHGFEASNTHTGGSVWSMFSTNNSDGYFGGGKFGIANETMGNVDANTAAVFVIDGTGKVGIGDTAPQDVLEVRGTSLGGITISNGNHNQAALSFARNSTATARMFITEPAATHTSTLNFQTSNASGGPNLITAMTIDQNQNVGIGTTAVTSPGLWYDANPGYLAISHWSTPPTPAAMLHLSDNSNDLDVPQIRIEGRENAGDTKLDISVKDAGTRMSLIEGSGDAGQGYGLMEFKTNAAANASHATRGGFKFSTVADANNLFITNTGSIGIGTDSPAKPLHLNVESGWATMRLEGAGDSGGELEFYATSTKKGSIWFGNDASFNLRVADTNAFSITSGRQVKVYNAANVALDVLKGSRFGYGASYKCVVLGGAGTTTSDNVAIGYDPSGNTSGSFTGYGESVYFRHNVRIRTPNAANNAWHTMMSFTNGRTLVGYSGSTLSSNNGGGMDIFATGGGPHVMNLKNSDTSGGANMIRFIDGSGHTCGEINSNATNNTTSYGTSSDGRYKDVIGEARGLEIINSLNPVKFTWKSSGEEDEGLIAQEVLAIVPNAITGSEETKYMMDYSKLVTPLIKAVQEQQTLIESLTARIEELEG